MRSNARAAIVVIAVMMALASPAAAVELQGHRGARGLLPENTLPAFERALEIGVDTLELDVGVTKDGIVVISHNRALKRDLARRDGEWIADEPLIAELTYAELMAFDVGRPRPGSRTARRFPEQQARDGTRVPRLAALFAMVRDRGDGRVGFNIETKISPQAPGQTRTPRDFVERLLAVVREYDLAARTSIQSFDWRSLALVREIAPEIRTVHLSAEQRWLDNIQRGQSGASPWLGGLDIDDHGGSIPRAIKAMGGAVWSPYHRDITAKAIAEAHGLGLEVVVWTVNKPADMRRLIKLGVDGIITDYPDRARAVIGGQ